MIKAVIFDLNGVFIQAPSYFSTRAQETYGVSEQEFYAALKDVMATARQPDAPSFFELWKPHLKKMGIEVSEKEFFKLWVSPEGLVPEVLEYAKELRQRGIKVFILSNNVRERTVYYRQKLPQLFDSVDQAYFSWETGFVKPDPQAYTNILNEHRLKPEECVYFDDSKGNVEVAKSLGIHAQQYTNLPTARKFLEQLKA